MIHIAKTGQIVTRNSKHMKETPITIEQYFWNQLSKGIVETVDDILKHFEKHTQQNVTYTHNKQVNKDTVNITSDSQQSDMQDKITKDSSQSQIAVHNEQKENPNYLSIHSDHEELIESTTTCTRYGRIVKWPDRLT